jgi:16S rRNA processing protein RimM
VPWSGRLPCASGAGCSSTLPEFVRVGQVTAPFGIEGAVKVYPLTDFEDRFAPGAELFLDGRAVRVEWWKPGHPTVTLKLAGIDNRTLAELHRGRYLEVPAEEARQLAEGSYYHHQLVGLEVVTASGRRVGKLSNVLERPANDVWVVAAEDGAEHLVPATRDAVIGVDLGAGRVTVQDWLFDVEEVR